ncbi:hypothetical protein ABIE09_001762 [Lysobacter enzymogenes]|uniref:hypothetical protein n=1 Tax=Lysobacter enzymogenes TaxID=69 RepID=UPI0033973F57
MLNRVIHWFEIGPVGTLLPYDIDAMEPFVVAGMLTEPKRTRHVECRSCKLRKSMQIGFWDERSVRCSRCSGVVQLGTEYLSVSVVEDWLPASLARQVEDLEARSVTLIEGRLWRLTRADAPRTCVYLLRTALHSELAPFLEVFERDSGPRRRVVITSSPLAAPPTGDPNQTFVALNEISHMDVEGIRLDIDKFLHLLREDAALWFDLPPPYNRLTLGGETLELRRNQRVFMRLLKEAHASGQATTSWRALIERAGYDSDYNYTSMWQLFSKNASRFIAWSKGEVWIRRAPEPKSSAPRAGPSRTKKDSS